LKEERESSLETLAVASTTCCCCRFFVLFWASQMVNTLKIENRLEGATNFWTSKAMVLLLLEENDLKEYVEGVFASPIDP
jgi:hypothetical protein